MESAYGDSGNSIREKHKARRGDFVMFADDDNWCVTSPQQPSVSMDEIAPLHCLRAPSVQPASTSAYNLVFSTALCAGKIYCLV